MPWRCQSDAEYLVFGIEYSVWSIAPLPHASLGTFRAKGSKWEKIL